MTLKQNTWIKLAAIINEIHTWKYFQSKAASGDRWPWLCCPFPVHLITHADVSDPTTQVYHLSVQGTWSSGCQPSGNRRTPAPFWADSRRAEWGRSKPGTLQLICLRGTFCFYFALYKSSTYMWFISSNAQERCKMKSKSFTVLSLFKDTVQWHQVHLCC